MSFQGVRLLAGVAAACGAAAVLTAQQQPVFKAGVELVQIDAVVTGADHRPVAGLSANDFAIYENGRRQSIVDFRPVSIPAASRTLDPRGTPAAFVSNDVPSNRRLFVLFVDNANIQPVYMRKTRELLTAVVEGLSPDDQVAVVTTAASSASLDLTSDPVLQARAVSALDAKAGTPYGFTVQPGHRIAFDVLENVIESLAQSRHARRVVVYVGPLTPFTLRWVDHLGVLNLLREGYTRTVEAARRANVALYAIHPLGADSLGATEDFSSDHAAFGRESGGRGFGPWTDHRLVAREILDDNRTFYVMSYYRDVANARDRKPAIDVRPARAGLTVRARKGYVADPGADPALSSLQTALAEALPLDGVRLRASVTPGLPSAEKRVRTELTLEITYPAEESATRVTDELRFGAVALDYDGRVLGTLGRMIAVNAAKTGGDTVHVIREAIDLPPGPAVVRLGVSSKILGKVGTVHVPVHVPR